jgi:hypothetical protein
VTVFHTRDSGNQSAQCISDCEGRSMRLSQASKA